MAEKYVSLVQQTHRFPPLAEAGNFTQPLLNPGHFSAQFATGNGVERLLKDVRDALCAEAVSTSCPLVHCTLDGCSSYPP